MKIRDMSYEDRPSYRLDEYGSGALSNAELLQIIMGSQTYDAPVALLANGLSGLARMTIAEMTDLPGVGPQTAIRIKAALELGPRLYTQTRTDPPRITAPADAANLLIPMLGNEDQEHLVVMMLASRNEVIKTEIIYKGNVNTVIVRGADIFKPAIRNNAVAVILAHNHPSGDPAPSPEDVQTTIKLIEAGKLLNIEVLDHVVIGGNRFVSMKERGLAFGWTR